MMEAKGKKQNFKPFSFDKKINEIPQINRLMTKKINFSHLKGNYNNSQLGNMIPTAIGPGGFLVPKMYQLNVES